MNRELRPLVVLALPIIQAELGWMSMGLVDTLMVGSLGPSAIGAVGTGSILFLAVMVVGMGTLLALDTFVSQNFGAGRIDECHRWLFAGLQLAGVLAVVLMGLTFGLIAALPVFGLHPDVLAYLRPYLSSLVWSTPPLLAYAVFRRYLQACHVVWPITFALILANLVNVAANWVLIHGHLGFPALGVAGSAWATVFSRVTMAGWLWMTIIYRERDRPSGLHDVPFAIDMARVWRIVRLGVPAAAQALLEVGVFAVATALAARIAPAAIAAHNIVLNIIGFIFMVPFGLGSAAAVRVGHAIGRGDPAGARSAGWIAVMLATGVMSASALLLWLAPGLLIRPFSADADVMTIGMGLMFVAAIFQLFDGVQAVATGALRGLGDTRTPMVVNLIGHWAVGLPLAYVLCFNYGWAAQGLWIGLAAGLIVTGGVLVLVWHRRSRLLAQSGL
ncbi:MAG TPA: MATE family efflux transporter [Vicinamibacterales bacterium]|nr:MATE family efflux transporter [Vicinamibacterales bacterium]